MGDVTCLERVSASWRNLHCHYPFAGHHHRQQLPKQPCQVKPPTSCFTHAKAARQAEKLLVEKGVGIPWALIFLPAHSSPDSSSNQTREGAPSPLAGAIPIALQNGWSWGQKSCEAHWPAMGRPWACIIFPGLNPSHTPVAEATH